MQGYKLTHVTYTVRWHYYTEIPHSMVQGINKDTAYGNHKAWKTPSP